MEREAATFAASPARLARGPSLITSSLAGLALAISANTRSVVSGRLKIMKATGVVSVKSGTEQLPEISDGLFQPVLQVHLRLPAQLALGQRDIGLALPWVIRGQRLKNRF